MEEWEKYFTNDVEMPQIILDKIDEALVQIETGCDEYVKKKGSKENFNKKRNTLNRWSKAAALIGFVLFLGSGSVVAVNRNWSLKDILKNLPEEAEQYIDKNVTVTDTADSIDNVDKDCVAKEEDIEKIKDLVTFNVKETIADPTTCQIAVEASLRDTEHYLLASADCDMKEEGMAYDYYGDAKEGESFEQYAKRVNKKILIVESCLDDSEEDLTKYFESIGEQIIKNGGHALLHIGLTCDGSEKNKFTDGTKLVLNHRVRLYENEKMEWKVCKNETETIGIKFFFEGTETADYGYDDENRMRVGDGPVTIKKITLTNSAFETRVDMVVVNEDKSLGNWVSINLIDDDGQIFDPGVTGSHFGSVPDSNGVFSWCVDYKRMDLPDHVNVRVRDLDKEVVYELKNIPLCK